MSDNGHAAENGKRYTLQRTERGAHGVNENLSRREIIQLADAVQAKNPALAQRLRNVAGGNG